jgi:hypothetical protein
MTTFLLSSVLLKMADIWVRLFKRARLFRRRDVRETLLPQNDKSPAERSRRIEEERELYTPVRLAEKLQINSRLRLRTLQELPAVERYPIGILIPKLLIIFSLKMRGGSTKSLSSFRQLENLYRILGSPRILNDWKNDDEFVRQRLQGINPVWIRRCDDPAELLHRGLDKNVCEQLKKTQRGHPLYVVNYHELLQDIPSEEGRYLAPAIAFFEQIGEALQPLGIQLHSPEHGAVWIRPDGSAGWTLAKMFFNSADLFVHEALTHLLWTHLFLENYWIAAVRNLSEKHPVRKLLAPHFHFCLNANANSNKILLGESGIFAELFSAGRAGTIRLLEKGEDLWTLNWTALPDLLERNGTRELPGYLYRDDGMLIWQAVESYVQKYLNLYYRKPDDLTADFELQAWSAELAAFFGPGKIPPIGDFKTLQATLTTILFSVVQHTFVGAVQYEYIAYPPAMPPLMRVPVPAAQEQVREEDLLRALPALRDIYTIVKATYAFSMQYTTLGRHLEAYHRDADALSVVRDFQTRLQEIEKIISERDAERAKPYRISSPRQIANSVSA